MTPLIETIGRASFRPIATDAAAQNAMTRKTSAPSVFSLAKKTSSRSST